MTSTSPLQKYTKYLVITGVVLTILSAFAGYFSSDNMHPLWPVLLLFVIGVQWLVFAFVSKFAQHKTGTMLRQYQIAKYAKLAIYFIMLAIYVFAIKAEKKDAVAFLLNFIVYYLVFTVLEVWFFNRWMNTLPPTQEK